MKKKDETLIIGVDHGYGYVKTANTLMKSGIEELPEEQFFTDDILVFNDNVYAVGQNRTEQYEDKTQNLDYYILTLAAIARELQLKKIKKANNILLAVGLPYSYISRQRDDFKKYLGKQKNVTFKYEGSKYEITIKNVKVFPQGFPMITTELDSGVSDLTVADIGSRTIDVLTFHDGKPVYQNCFSLDNKGTLDCIEQIRKAHLSKFGGHLPEDIIQDIFIGKEVNLAPEELKFIKKQIKFYIDNILKELQNRGIYYNCTYCGGGASLIKNYAKDKIHSSAKIDDDIFGNAKGYEELALNL